MGKAHWLIDRLLVVWIVLVAGGGYYLLRRIVGLDVPLPLWANLLILLAGAAGMFLALRRPNT